MDKYMKEALLELEDRYPTPDIGQPFPEAAPRLSQYSPLRTWACLLAALCVAGGCVCAFFWDAPAPGTPSTSGVEDTTTRDLVDGLLLLESRLAKAAAENRSLSLTLAERNKAIRGLITENRRLVAYTKAKRRRRSRRPAVRHKPPVKALLAGVGSGPGRVRTEEAVTTLPDVVEGLRDRTGQQHTRDSAYEQRNAPTIHLRDNRRCERCLRTTDTSGRRVGRSGYNASLACLSGYPPTGITPLAGDACLLFCGRACAGKEHKVYYW